ncbi:Pre-mRNA-splicing factor 38, partial [Gorgonomyces haynaldii]
IHGSNPQFLIEKILRERIFESIYWKEKCFRTNAETIIDLAEDLRQIGGQYGNQKPTQFICLVLKLLQIQPEHEIVELYLNSQYKYLTALTCFYIRLVYPSAQVYKLLEPFLLDNRKLRKREQDGSHTLTFMDEFVDQLLTEDRVCDTILPRLTKRFVLEDSNELEPRSSPLEDEIEMQESE